MFRADSTHAAAVRTAPVGSRPPETLRPEAKGKFLYLGDEKFWVRGVTYGTFGSPAGEGGFPDRARVAQDFSQIAANGFTAVRTYTVPPRWALDAAYEHGLRLLIGLPWEEHVAFLEEPGRARSIERRVRAGVRSCAGHPAVLAYAIGNEIPASIVRWHGRRRVESFLARLADASRAEDPGGLVTYVGFPTTEYLELACLDLVCFNVYLESRECFAAYLARLQNVAGGRPLILTETGLEYPDVETIVVDDGFSGRSACYLAAGKPVITQDTGFDRVVPTGRGLFAFRTPDEAVAALDAVARDYDGHRRAAREIAAEYFDAGRVLRRLLDEASV